MREKKGNRRRTTLSLLNADAKALCLRPDPELVRVFGIPRRRRSVESCPSAAADEDLRSPPPARRRARGGVAKNTRAFATLRRRKTRRVVIGSSLNCWGESTSPMKARRPVELRGTPHVSSRRPRRCSGRRPRRPFAAPGNLAPEPRPRARLARGFRSPWLLTC